MGRTLVNAQKRGGRIRVSSGLKLWLVDIMSEWSVFCPLTTEWPAHCWTDEPMDNHNKQMYLCRLMTFVLRGWNARGGVTNVEGNSWVNAGQGRPVKGDWQHSDYIIALNVTCCCWPFVHLYLCRPFPTDNATGAHKGCFAVNKLSVCEPTIKWHRGHLTWSLRWVRKWVNSVVISVVISAVVIAVVSISMQLYLNVTLLRWNCFSGEILIAPPTSINVKCIR